MEGQPESLASSMLRSGIAGFCHISPTQQCETRAAEVSPGGAIRSKQGMLRRSLSAQRLLHRKTSRGPMAAGW